MYKTDAIDSFFSESQRWHFGVAMFLSFGSTLLFRRLHDTNYFSRVYRSTSHVGLIMFELVCLMAMPTMHYALVEMWQFVAIQALLATSYCTCIFVQTFLPSSQRMAAQPKRRGSLPLMGNMPPMDGKARRLLGLEDLKKAGSPVLMLTDEGSAAILPKTGDGDADSAWARPEMPVLVGSEERPALFASTV